jgi:hypothetical protein
VHAEITHEFTNSGEVQENIRNVIFVAFAADRAAL